MNNKEVKKKNKLWLVIALVGLIGIIAGILIANLSDETDDREVVSIPYAVKDIALIDGMIKEEDIDYKKVLYSEFLEKYDGKIEETEKEIVGKCLVKDVKEGEFFYIDNLVECSYDNDNTIFEELKKELDVKIKAVTTNTNLVESLIFNQSPSVIADIGEEYYAYLSNVVYEYYIAETGNQREKFTSNSMEYGPCYEQGQNGYCYVTEKDVLLSYAKKLFNLDEKIFTGSYALVKDDKIYVTPVADGGYVISFDFDSIVSTTKEDNKDIVYIAKYNVVSEKDGSYVMNVKFTFKLNENNDYYLYSIEKV